MMKSVVDLQDSPAIATTKAPKKTDKKKATKKEVKKPTKKDAKTTAKQKEDTAEIPSNRKGGAWFRLYRYILSLFC